MESSQIVDLMIPEKHGHDGTPIRMAAAPSAQVAPSATASATAAAIRKPQLKHNNDHETITSLSSRSTKSSASEAASSSSSLLLSNNKQKNMPLLFQKDNYSNSTSSTSATTCTASNSTSSTASSLSSSTTTQTHVHLISNPSPNNSENDCTTITTAATTTPCSSSSTTSSSLVTKTNKPLHLQIMDDGAFCSSSASSPENTLSNQYENNRYQCPSSLTCSVSTNHGRLMDNHQSVIDTGGGLSTGCDDGHGRGIPVTLDRDDILNGTVKRHGFHVHNDDDYDIDENQLLLASKPIRIHREMGGDKNKISNNNNSDSDSIRFVVPLVGEDLTATTRMKRDKEEEEEEEEERPPHNSLMNLSSSENPKCELLSNSHNGGDGGTTTLNNVTVGHFIQNGGSDENIIDNTVIIQNSSKNNDNPNISFSSHISSNVPIDIATTTTNTTRSVSSTSTDVTVTKNNDSLSSSLFDTNESASSKSFELVKDTVTMPSSSNDNYVNKQPPKESISIDVASALDQVLADLEEENSKKKKVKQLRPCILQQSLVGGDTNSSNSCSGTSTPNDEDALENNNNNSNSVMTDDKKKSILVESSMLLPEDSLNFIAQMKLGGIDIMRDEKKTVVTFGENSTINNELSPTEEEVQQQVLKSDNVHIDTTTITSPTDKNIMVNERMNILPINNQAITSPIIPLPPNNHQSVNYYPNSNTPKTTKRSPLISGTAAAQLYLTQKSSPNNSLSERVDSSNKTDDFSFQNNMQYLTNSTTLHTPTQVMSKESEKKSTVNVNQTNDNNVKEDEKFNAGGGRWDEGMNVLAYITSNAVPLRTNTSHSDSPDEKQNNNSKLSSAKTMVPIGQSLRLYSSIAAEAGVATYSPVTILTEDIEITKPITQHQPQVVQQSKQEQQSLQKQPQILLQQEQQLQQSQLLQQQSILQQQQQHQSVVCHPQIIEQPQPPEYYTRDIGKIRRYNAGTKSFGEWEDLPCQTYGDTEPRRWCDLNIDESIEIPLRRGGRLRVFPNFLGEGRRVVMKGALDDCRFYRQYSAFIENKEIVEPRLQVLLSSRATEENCKNSVDGVGYVYNGVSMKAQPLSREPHVQALAHDLADLYRLPNKEWNIGANLVYYRDGNDHTNWNADDTQEENLILCIVVDSASHVRPVLVKPKNLGGFQDGDEEIIIYVGPGDAYEMDGYMQRNYEHCLPAKYDDMNAKRSAIIFRQSQVESVTVNLDTGTPLIQGSTNEDTKIEPQNNAEKISAHFGHTTGNMREGKKLYTKNMLVEYGAHRQGKKLVCGSMREGCESILVESQDRLLREDDGLYWLQISCPKKEGGGALCQSYHKKTCIRVFRSSDLESKYAPALYEGEEDQVLYRYDGLYTVRAMWDSNGLETELPPVDDSVHTFFLMRQPKRPADCTPENMMNYNKISLQELWNEIQKRRGVRKPKKFAVPEPNMVLGRIGDKSNARRRPASTRRVLNNDTESSIKKPYVSKRSVNVIQSRFCQHRAMYSSDSDSGIEIDHCDDSDEEIESMKNNNNLSNALLFSDKARPRRKSAAVARTYLKEVMHNKYGDMDKNTSTEQSQIKGKKKRSIWSTHPEKDEGKISKRFCKSDESSDDDDSNDLPKENVEKNTSTKNIKGEDVVVMKEEEKVKQEAEQPPTVDEVNSLQKKDISDNESTPVIENKKQIQRNRIKPKPLNYTSTETFMNNEDDDKDTQYSTSSDEQDEDIDKMDPYKIQEGSRVHVEYRNTLFKATVRRIRSKDGKHQYLIHYDGNKKSNVHWIPFTMVHTILDEKPVIIAQEPQPKRSRKRKLSDIKQSPTKKLETEITKKEEATTAKEPDNYKFSIGSEVFVDHKKVLYRSTVRNARKNKKGNVEYLVHYDGFKKTSDRWMKEATLYEINDDTTKRFNNERGFQSNGDTTVTNGNESRVKSDTVKEGDDSSILKESDSDAKKSGRGLKRKSTELAIKPQSKSDDAGILDMSSFDSGVEFLPGSCVFIAKGKALYLAKMIKRRKKGKGMEYLVQFDGMSSDHNEWISLNNIFELNPKTRKIYEKTKDDRIIPQEDDEGSSSEDEVRVQPNERAIKTVSKKSTRGTNKGKLKSKKQPQTSRLYDLQNIESGVEFLPGSTLFVQWKNGLYLGKMLKKRGKGNDMEYLIHYDGYKSTQDQWVSVSLVFEINPQTKRVFNKQKKENS